jgi:hypothetical protein
MRTLVKPGITLLTITALIALGRLPLSAQSVLFSRTLLKSYFSYGNSAATAPLVAGLQAVDSPVTVNCPTNTTSTTCTIEGEMRLQLGMGNFSGNFYSICLKVDGTIVEGGGCPSMGVIPQGAWTVTSFAEVKKVSARHAQGSDHGLYSLWRSTERLLHEYLSGLQALTRHSSFLPLRRLHRMAFCLAEEA